MTINDQKLNQALIAIIRDAMEGDEKLREKYHIANKFRFIRERLQILLAKVEQSLAIAELHTHKKQEKKQEDEVLVYVYLYNAQGLTLQSWQKMLNPAFFYEYSVNRPIYAERSQVEAFLRSKTNKSCYAYLEIAVKKEDIIPQKPDEPLLLDRIGGALLKVKEGSLHFNRVMSFVHNNITYELNDAGMLQKIEE